MCALIHENEDASSCDCNMLQERILRSEAESSCSLREECACITYVIHTRCVWGCGKHVRDSVQANYSYALVCMALVSCVREGKLMLRAFLVSECPCTRLPGRIFTRKTPYTHVYTYMYVHIYRCACQNEWRKCKKMHTYVYMSRACIQE
jgi:hypothetical protein